MMKSRRISIVDDESDIALTLKSVLEYNGFIVDMFNDPILALQNFEPDFYDLIILDIKMPKMNGFDLYEQIRKIDNKVKACFLTAFGEGYTEEFGRRFPSSINVSFIRKPIRIDDLVKKVNELVIT